MARSTTLLTIRIDAISIILPSYITAPNPFDRASSKAAFMARARSTSFRVGENYPSRGGG
jgi:hypothetical protein